MYYWPDDQDMQSFSTEPVKVTLRSNYGTIDMCDMIHFTFLCAKNAALYGQVSDTWTYIFGFSFSLLGTPCVPAESVILKDF